MCGVAVTSLMFFFLCGIGVLHRNRNMRIVLFVGAASSSRGMDVRSDSSRSILCVCDVIIESLGHLTESELGLYWGLSELQFDKQRTLKLLRLPRSLAEQLSIYTRSAGRPCWR